jgi:hypothetical protein
MPPTAAWTHTETQGVNLGVPRRTRTFARILGAVADAPDRSLPAALGPGLPVCVRQATISSPPPRRPSPPCFPATWRRL